MTSLIILQETLNEALAKGRSPLPTHVLCLPSTEIEHKNLENLFSFGELLGLAVNQKTDVLIWLATHDALKLADYINGTREREIARLFAKVEVTVYVRKVMAEPLTDWQILPTNFPAATKMVYDFTFVNADHERLSDANEHIYLRCQNSAKPWAEGTDIQPLTAEPMRSLSFGDLIEWVNPATGDSLLYVVDETGFKLTYFGNVYVYTKV